MYVVELLYVEEHAFVILGHEVYGHTLPPKSSTSSNTMEIVLGLSWQIVVDNKRDLLHIDTTGQEIGGDEDTGGTGSEFPHDYISCVLVHVTMGGRDGMVTAAHLVCKPVHLAPCVDEDDTLCDGQGLVEIAQGFELPIFLVHINVELLNTLKGELITLHENTDRFVHKFPCDLKCLWWHSSRKYTNLNLGRQQLEDVVYLEEISGLDRKYSIKLVEK